ncbi:MAG: rhomboid family intramembrane serine protease [Mycobacteriales bacterium]
MVIPIHDRNPTRTTPYVTLGLIAANAVVFLLSPAARGIFRGNSTSARCREQRFFQHWGAIPTELTHNDTIAYTVGKAAGPGLCVRVPVSYDKVPALSALTSMFVHGGWLHILGNMLFLWVFGNNVEDRFGHIRYLIFYLAAGMAAAYGFALTRPDSATTLIGASGAIAGVLGAYLVLYPKARITSLVPFLLFLPLRLPAWLVLLVWFGLQAVYAEGAGTGSGGVAYLVHVVGFVLGLAIGWSVRRFGHPPKPRRSFAT